MVKDAVYQILLILVIQTMQPYAQKVLTVLFCTALDWQISKNSVTSLFQLSRQSQLLEICIAAMCLQDSGPMKMAIYQCSGDLSHMGCLVIYNVTSFRRFFSHENAFPLYSCHWIVICIADSGLVESDKRRDCFLCSSWFFHLPWEVVVRVSKVGYTTMKINRWQCIAMQIFFQSSKRKLCIYRNVSTILISF